LLWALNQCGDDDVKQVLSQSGLSAQTIETELERIRAAADPNQVFVGQIGYSADAQAALNEAAQLAEHEGHAPASFGHILLSLLVSGELSVLLARFAEAQDAAHKEIQARMDRQKKLTLRRKQDEH
jgi:ATP-dependent Clp protease ATP-binding subunit ClpA